MDTAIDLHSRAAPNVGGSITAQLVQPQGEIPEEGRKTRKNCFLSIQMNLILGALGNQIITVKHKNQFGNVSSTVTIRIPV